MRYISIFVAFLFLTSAPIQAESIDESVEAKIQLVISEQIKAFKNFDVKTAYSYASSLIRSIFPNAVIFGKMVENSYPMIWNPKDYQFLSLRNETGIFIQRVIFTDDLDRIFIFDYMMELSEGAWLVNGVYPINQGDGV